MAIQILYVEEDYDLAETVIQYLETEKILCDHTSNGQTGLQLATDNIYDLVLAEIDLPLVDGVSLCKSLRKDGKDMPIMMLTSRNTLDDKIACFEAGADDCLAKPFAMRELLFRIKALARRRSGQSRLLRVADLIMDLDKREAYRNGLLLNLTPFEWMLLETLMRQSPNLVSREKLAQVLWGHDRPESNSLKVHIHNLRKRVDEPFERPLIVTIPGQGLALRPLEGEIEEQALVESDNLDI